MTTQAKTKPAWGRWLEYAVYAVLASVLLYRCVLPVPSAGLDAASGFRVPVEGPTMVEFVSSRCPACIAMGPLVGQLKQAYAGRVAFKVYTLDQLKPEQLEEVQAIAQAGGVERTPTYLLVDATGRIRSKHEGVTSYMSLTRAFDSALKPAP